MRSTTFLSFSAILFLAGLALAATWIVRDTARFDNLRDNVASLQKEVKDAKAKPRFSFIVMGETEGVNPVLQRIVEEANKTQPAFLVHVADVTADGSDESYQAVKSELDKLTIPYYVVMGNNDLDEEKTTSRFEKYFGEPYRAFDYENAHFVLLDNALRTMGFDDEQQAWLDSDLSRNTQPFVFLFYHRSIKTPLESLTGDDETPVSRRNNTDTLTILEKYTIEHIFSAHVHVYFPYKLVTPNGTELNVSITGGGGATPHERLGGEKIKDYHYLLVDVFDDHVEINKKEIVL